MQPRLKEIYHQEVVPAMAKKFNYKNRLQAPRVEKIVLNMGVGEAITDIKILDKAMEELALIAGQKPMICRSKKAISNFKIKQGNPIGCKVTLRRNMMYEFLDRLLNVALPRIKDFRGVSADAFDAKGNYSLGINEQTIFPEIDYDKIQRTQGMNITIVTNARSKDEARELLRLFGMPFKE
jgi:large subunit ribosomal protein L5